MRRDIQLLRGIAVLLVVIFHSNLGIFEYGYLGVDVFFVVSGFLITSIILRDLDSKTFVFSQFYLRRAKRLLPALYSTLIFTTVLAFLLLTPSHLEEYFAQLFGAVTFSANMVLPTQISYFANEAEGKPLLHIWSLSLEEQYYFFLPLALFLVPKVWRIGLLVCLFLASLIWCLTWVTSSDIAPLLWRLSDVPKSDWAFYLFPTRAWELLAGSVAAWLMLYKPDITIKSEIKVLSLLTVILLTSINIDSVHPRLDALIIVLATSLMLLGKDDWVPKNRSFQAIEKIGDWSYSIYLVHWPLFAFAFISTLGQTPIFIKFSLVALSVLLGALQYKYIETPFRKGWKSSPEKSWAILTGFTLFLLILPALYLQSSNSIDEQKLTASIAEVRQPNYGLSKECDSPANLESPSCISGENPKAFVWGDSYAMHLIPGLVKKLELIQLTKSSCGPFMGLSRLSSEGDKARTADWAFGCIEFNDLAFDLIASSTEIKYVILSSVYSPYFDRASGKFVKNNLVVDKNYATAEQSLIETINGLVKNNKVPILVSPPPRSGFDIGECLNREELGLPIWRSNCQISKEDYLSYDSEVIQSLKRVERETNVMMIWLDDVLCDSTACKTKMNNRYVYRDKGHLTRDGSVEVFKQLSLEFMK